MDQFEVLSLKGFHCEVKLLNDGLFLNLDTSTKFLCEPTVLDEIDRLRWDEKLSRAEISTLLCPKYTEEEQKLMSREEQSQLDASRLVVITSYNSNAYQVDEIMWDENPTTIKFKYKEPGPLDEKPIEKVITIAEYLFIRYGIRLKDFELK